MDNTMLALKNISKSYETNDDIRRIFDYVSIEIRAGERIGIVGANASGKSTLLKLLMKQEPANIGEVLVNITNDKISYLPQDYRNALFPWLKVNGNFSLLLNGLSDSEYKLSLSQSLKSEIEMLFEKLEMKVAFDKYPYQLSGGEQQVLLLIQLFIRNSSLIVADEPFSAIDFHKREIIINYFSEWIQKNKITLIMVSHDIEEAVYLSDRIIILSKNSTKIKDDFQINIPFPRKPEIRFEQRFQDIIRHIKLNFE